jgi:hypothetical protein
MAHKDAGEYVANILSGYQTRQTTTCWEMVTEDPCGTSSGSDTLRTGETNSMEERQIRGRVPKNSIETYGKRHAERNVCTKQCIAVD